MDQISLIPHYIFHSHISLKKKTNSFFQYEQDEVELQSSELREILSSLETIDKEVYCWFTIDNQVTVRQRMVIESHLEKVLEERMTNGWDVQVLLLPIGQSFSLENCLIQIEILLMSLKKRYPTEYIGQIVGAKTNLVSQAFLIECLRQFPQRYISLYWDGSKTASVYHPGKVNPKSWYRLFREFIQDYDYQGALELLSDINISSNNLKAIEAILRSQLKRMNFAFEEAEQFLTEAMNLLGSTRSLSETKTIFSKLLSNDREIKELERIAELFRQIEVYVQIDDLPSFLIRLYRAREAVLFYLLQFGQTNGNTHYPMEQKSSIYQVFEVLEDLYDNFEIDGYFGAYFFLKSNNVAGILDSRNKSFIGHSRKPIYPKELWNAFAGNANRTLAKTKRRFLMDVDLMLRDLGIKADENFTSLNLLILQLAEDIKKEDGYAEGKTNHSMV
ncbi:hypothetical protein [Neobacillus dielmonensis]|uniref:hypothetical protein n=1 Tax=Neobacillus dielmonensis TaxID=1347369 RepID=UPI0005AB1C8F|nr:hypothetical protein [Neobacillus dielmonensis]